MFSLTSSERAAFDDTLEPLLTRAQEQAAEAEQLAMDATRLLSVRPEQIVATAKQSFYQRAMQKFIGVSNVNSISAQQTQLVELQKVGWRYLQILNERDLMMAHSMITVKNNLMTLAVKETETRKMVTEMAGRIADRFVSLEKRMAHLESQQNIHSWLLTVETYDYPERYPERLRLLRLVQDFLGLKPFHWNVTEIKYLQKALKEAELPWREELTLAQFIDGLIEEIEAYGFEMYQGLIELPVEGGVIEHKYLLDQVSVPSHKSLYKIADSYTSSSETIDILADQLSVDKKEALKKVLRGFIEKEGINVEMKLPLRDLAVELLGCHSLGVRLFQERQGQKKMVNGREKGVDAREHYHSAAQIAWSDGQLTEEEKKHLDELATRLGLSVKEKEEVDAECKKERRLPRVVELTTPPMSLPSVEYIHGWSSDEVQALQKQTAQALNRPIVLRDQMHGGREGPEMVVIPAGIFLMGSPNNEPERNSDEGPEHRVTFSKPFAIGRYAVTFEEYDFYCEMNGVSKPSDEGWGRGKRPVICVSREEAVKYCEWLSKETGKRYRLPSEAEWEYACRAGTTTPFWWGSKITSDQANCDGDFAYNGDRVGVYRKKTVLVDEFQSNPFGLYQMHGNVWEWCEDYWHGNYNRAPSDGTAWVKEGGSRMVRGGSWYDAPQHLRSARRQLVVRSRTDDVGFRLAQDI